MTIDERRRPRRHAAQVWTKLGVATAMLVTVVGSTGPADAAGTSSSSVSAPYSASSTRTFTCEQGSLGTPPTCSAPSPLSTDGKTGSLVVGSSSAPMSVTSPAGGAAPTDGYGAAWAGLNMWHKTNAAASTVTTRFFFSVDTAVASFTGAGTSARLAVFGSTSCGVCTPADAYQLVIAVSDGITTTTPQPTYEVDVTMSSPSGSIPRGTMIGYSAALEAVVGADAAPWSGAGATCGAVRLTRVTFSA